MKRLPRLLAVSLLSLFVVACSDAPKDPEVVVYTSRKDHLIRPVFDLYSRETGVRIRYTTDDDGALITRLAAEGRNSPADLLITVDAGNLWQAAERGLFQPVESEVLTSNIPANLRDPDNLWFGQTVRARTIVYSTERVSPDQLSSYEALAEPQWRGRLCLRTSKKVYNQSLVATLIERHGEAQAEIIVRGWIDNLATDVFSNDNALMEAVAAGQCDVGIVNTYYFGRLLADKPGLPIRLFWANQDGSGVHINISGVGLTAHAPNREEAIRLIEWMSTEAPQRLLAEQNLEYPVHPDVAPIDAVAAWGEFRGDDLNVAVAGQRQVQAVKLMDRAGYR
ncbi:MAG: extracellular solute-binding protein [Alcanivoracaceae bacterium]